MFPFITKDLQEAYEQGTKGSPDKTPEICGFYGRACSQLGKEEGANRVLCRNCGLARYCTPYDGRSVISREAKR